MNIPREYISPKWDVNAFTTPDASTNRAGADNSSVYDVSESSTNDDGLLK